MIFDKSIKPQDFLSFDKMVTPFVIKIVYWIAIVGIVYLGISEFGRAVDRDRLSPVLIGLAYLTIGPIYVRVMCELVLVAFNILEELRSIRKGNRDSGSDAPNGQSEQH